MQLEELHTKVDELTAKVAESEDIEKEKEASHKAALKAMEEKHKMAIDEKEKNAKSAMDEEEKKKEASYKSMKASLSAAMDNEEDEKKKEGMKAALKAMDEEHKKEAQYGKKADMDNPKEYEKTAQDKEKEREQSAQITYLTAEIIKPKILQLETLYQASKTSDEQIKEYKADWEKATGSQLDAEIKKMINIVGKVNSSQTYEAQNSAFGFGTHSNLRKNQFDASTLHDKFDKMTDEELFTPGVN